MTAVGFPGHERWLPDAGIARVRICFQDLFRKIRVVEDRCREDVRLGSVSQEDPNDLRVVDLILDGSAFVVNVTLFQVGAALDQQLGDLGS